MRRIAEIILQDRPFIIGASGTVWTVALKHIHTTIGILVGLLTIVYLTMKICQALKRKSDD